MATSKETADRLLELLEPAGDVTARKMFGEYSLYKDGRVVALIADECLFIKPSSADSAFSPKCESAPPYPGAKDYWMVPEDAWDEKWVVDAIKETAKSVPAPKPKKK